MKVALSIVDWFALSSGCDDRNSWRQHYAAPLRDEKPVVVLPAMMRRRMSALTKLTLRCSISLAQRTEHVDYAIFASRHGELQRTTTLIQSLAADEAMSPMGFAQSVHNTAAGLHTIIAKQALPVSSMAAGSQTFAQAWLEVFIYLQQYPRATVLLQYFDEPVPEVFAASCQQPSTALAFALLLRSDATDSATPLPYRDDSDLLSLLEALIKAGESGEFTLNIGVGDDVSVEH